MTPLTTINYPFPGFSLTVSLTAEFIAAANFTYDRPQLQIEGVATKLCQRVISQLASYQADPGFQFSLPLQFSGSLHQLKVWQVLQQIAPGAVLSYAQVAKLLNSAPRAVGGACGRNPLALFIPCHRVIAANGHIGGFKQGHSAVNLAIKQWLLQHESRIRVNK